MMISGSSGNVTLKITKRDMCIYEIINLDDYIQSGEGGQSLTYTRKDGKAMAKLFLKSYGADTAEREFRISQAVYKLGIPSPEPFRLVTDGERFGGEYEVIDNKRLRNPRALPSRYVHAFWRHWTASPPPRPACTETFTSAISSQTA